MLALITFLGGLSAATAMVIVDCVALAIMISNDLVLPIFLSGVCDHAPATRRRRCCSAVRASRSSSSCCSAYLYYREAPPTRASPRSACCPSPPSPRFAPAFVGGLVWRRQRARRDRRAHRPASRSGPTLLLPSPPPGPDVGPRSGEGPLGIAVLRPQRCSAPIRRAADHGVMWSLALNTLLFVLGSLSRGAAEAMERIQAAMFVRQNPMPARAGWPRRGHRRRPRRRSPAISAASARSAPSRPSSAAGTTPSSPTRQSGRHRHCSFAEQLLASAIGSASSRLVLSLLLRKRTVRPRPALHLLDDAEALSVQPRHPADRARPGGEGIAVFDHDLPDLLEPAASAIFSTCPRIGDRRAAGRHRCECCAQGLPRPAISRTLVQDRVHRYAARQPFMERFAAAGGSSRCAPTRCPTAASSPTSPTSRRAVEVAEALERRVASAPPS